MLTADRLNGDERMAALKTARGLYGQAGYQQGVDRASIAILETEAGIKKQVGSEYNALASTAEKMGDPVARGYKREADAYERGAERDRKLAERIRKSLESASK